MHHSSVSEEPAPSSAFLPSSRSAVDRTSSCRASPAPPRSPSSKGDEQTERREPPSEDQIVVRIVDQRGTPVAGQRVAFTPGQDAQGALVRPEAATTNSDGRGPG